jgi:hypothetical protein
MIVARECDECFRVLSWDIRVLQDGHGYLRRYRIGAPDNVE